MLRSESGLREVGRRDEHHLLVSHDCLGVENARWTLRFKGARVVEHVRTRRSRPVAIPEAFCETANEVVGGGRVAALALYVQEKRDLEIRERLHFLGQGLEGAGAVEEGVGAGPDRPGCRVDDLVVDAAGVAGVKPRNLRPGPDEVRGWRSCRRVGPGFAATRRRQPR